MYPSNVRVGLNGWLRRTLNQGAMKDEPRSSLRGGSCDARLPFWKMKARKKEGGQFSIRTAGAIKMEGGESLTFEFLQPTRAESANDNPPFDSRHGGKFLNRPPKPDDTVPNRILFGQVQEF